MNKLICVLLSVLILFTGCTSETEYGDCIGVAEEADPNLRYETDTGNIIMAVIFFEMIFPPLIVLLSETKCPVGVKKQTERL